MSRLARTVEVWEAEIVAYQRTGMSNTVTDAMNLLVDKARRVGHGFRNWETYRLRCSTAACNRKLPPTANTRGHSPALVASSP